MSIWKKPVSIEALTTFSMNTAVTHLGIEFLEVGDDFLSARVPVDERTKQPYGLLHGGVSVVLAETLGSTRPPAAGSPAQRGPFTWGAPRRCGRSTW
jgi:1,4-dihydroxy-2-naphthoyl-CoA hydrolase